jgi:hypothetical protein
VCNTPFNTEHVGFFNCALQVIGEFYDKTSNKLIQRNEEDIRYAKTQYYVNFKGAMTRNWSRCYIITASLENCREIQNATRRCQLCLKEILKEDSVLSLCRRRHWIHKDCIENISLSNCLICCHKTKDFPIE